MRLEIARSHRKHNGGTAREGSLKRLTVSALSPSLGRFSAGNRLFSAEECDHYERGN